MDRASRGSAERLFRSSSSSSATSGSGASAQSTHGCLSRRGWRLVVALMLAAAALVVVAELYTLMPPSTAGHVDGHRSMGDSTDSDGDDDGDSDGDGDGEAAGAEPPPAVYRKDIVVPETPMSWEHVQHLVSSGQVDQLGRSTQGLAVYRRDMAAFHREWRTMGDLVRHKIFGYPRTASPEDNKWRLLPPEQGGVELVDPKHPPADRHPRIILRPNDYPYHLEEGIVHYLLWFEWPVLVTRETVEEELRGPFQGHEVIFWINPVRVQSVRDVLHVQIMARPATDPESPMTVAAVSLP